MIFGTLFACALALILWSKKSDHQKANRYLALSLFTSGITYSIYGLLYPNQDLSNQYPHLFFIPLALEILILPFCYFYIRQIYLVTTTPQNLKIWWHFSPFLLASLLLLPILFGDDEMRQTIIHSWFDGSYVESVHFSITAIGLILLSQLIGYLFLILKAHRTYQRFIKSIFSEIESVKLQWVTGIIVIWSLYLAIHLSLFIIPILFHNNAFDYFVYFFITINVLFYLYIAIRAVQHPFLFDSKNWHSMENFTQKEEPSQKYDHSPLSQEKASEIQERLIECLENEKPFLDSDLTINQLAKSLDLTSSKMLSQVLNQVMHESFYQLINRYRVEEALKLLQEKPTSSIIDVAFGAGFKSTSTFYNHFKAITGKTPKEFLEKAL